MNGMIPVSVYPEQKDRKDAEGSGAGHAVVRDTDLYRKRRETGGNDPPHSTEGMRRRMFRALF